MITSVSTMRFVLWLFIVVMAGALMCTDSFLSHCRQLRIAKSARWSSSLRTETEPPTTSQPNTFSWTKQWYPIAVEAFTDKTRPNKLMILGNDVVLWFNNSRWAVFEDTCPHRGVPLSEGRIEKNGTLLCAYHAWQFDSSGQCVSIPQSRTKEKELALLSNAKSCVRSYPTQVAQGLIWMWGESGLPGSDVALEATVKSPQLIEELTDPRYASRVLPYTYNQRDLPYGWDFFMENTLDPAHVAVSHHGIVGNRYKNAVYLNLTRVPSRSEIPLDQGGLYNPAYPGDVGFNHRVEIAGGDALVAQSYNDFRPPSLNKIERNNSDGSKLILALYATPTRPGYCRHIGAQILIKSYAGKVPGGLGAFALPMPQWLMHLTASLFLHQDQVFLHHQERKLLQASPIAYAFGRFNSSRFNVSSHPRIYAAGHFTPNEHDVGITKLRRWIHKQAQGGPQWGNAALATGSGLPTTLPPAQLFNVYDSHVASCTVCQRALRNAQRLRVTAVVVLSLMALAGRPVGRIKWAIAAAASAVGLTAHKIVGLFHYYPYNHQDNE